MAVSQASIRLVDPVLGGLIVGALQKPTKFVARQILPPISVGGKGATGRVFLEHPPSFMGDPSVDLRRPPGADILAINVDGPGTPVTYTCQSRSAKAPKIPKEHLRRSQLGVGGSVTDFGDLTADEMAYLQKRSHGALAAALRVVEELDCRNLFFQAATGWADSTLALLGNGASGIQLGAATYATATPLRDMDVARTLTRNNSHGVDPDTVIIGQTVADHMRRCAEVRNVFVTVQNAGGGQTAVAAAGSAQPLLTEGNLVAIIQSQVGIPNVYICGARRRTNVPNQADTEDFIWEDNVWLGSLRGIEDPDVRANNDVSMQPRAAAMFLEQEVEANLEWKWENQSFHAWVDESYDMAVLDTSLGRLVRDWVT